MINAYILGANRTAVGTFCGSLRNTSAVDLGVKVVEETIRRSHVNVNDIDQIIMGNVLQAGLGQNPARQIGLLSSIPLEVPAVTINKVCGSGLNTVSLSRLLLGSGEAEVILAGGVENMSRAPRYVSNTRDGKKLGDLELIDGVLRDGLEDAIDGYSMGITAENIAKKFNISREEQDEYAYHSNMKADKAIKAGKFKNEIIPISIKVGRKEEEFLIDEHVRGNTSLQKLASLDSAFKRNGTVTAGNSSGINDGAASFVIVSENYVRENNLKPIAKIVTSASVGVDPSMMGLGPIYASKMALKKANLSVEAIDCWEINEAFAAQAIASIAQLKLDPNKVNVNGGAIALGHPIGASGARIVVSLLREMRRENMQYGCASLCIGGGMGETVIFERDELCR
ncbi:acetyl-CoA C-acetyltransferase [Enterococcus sp. AZ109]|uniref:acetyl-CoA C-acetyltransferase n=1 Tax=Enterococcus sp. AZ109 TaxID=2774634 RepID=UPI003F1FEBC9